MKKLVTLLGILICLLLCCFSIQAMDLMDVYHLALQNDPIFKRALAQYLEDKEATALSRSALLPQIFVAADLSRERIHENGHVKDFNSYDLNTTLTQTVFDVTAFQRLAQAHAAVKQAAYRLAFAQQDLLLRVATAYFQVLQAKDVLHFTHLQLKANKNQINIILERLKVGHATITALDQAKAQCDIIAARYIREQVDLVDREQQLRRIISIPYGELAKLKDKLPLKHPEPNDLSHWINAATQQNLELLSRRFGVVAAQSAIRAAQGGHLPIISVSGQFNDFRSPFVNAIGNTFNPREKNFIGSINLNFPVIQGGLVLAQTRVAIAQYQQDIATMMETYENVLAETRDAFQGVNLGIEEIKANHQAVISNQSAYQHTLESYMAGMETTIDLLTQQNELFNAERNYATNRYRYLLNILRLKRSAGILKPADLMIINQWLVKNHTSQKKKQTRKKSQSCQAKITKQLVLPKPIYTHFQKGDMLTANLGNKQKQTNDN